MDDHYDKCEEARQERRRENNITDEVERETGSAGPAFTGESTPLVQLRKATAEGILSFLRNERDFGGDETDAFIAELQSELENRA